MQISENKIIENFLWHLFCVNFLYTPVMSALQYKFNSVVQGFHEYQFIWAPVVGKEFPCKHEVQGPCGCWPFV